MNDFERRLRDLGEKAKDDVSTGLAPSPQHLRRIRRRRLVASTGAFACVATVLAAGAFAWAGRSAESPPVPPADNVPSPSVDERACEPTSVAPRVAPAGFSKTLEMPRVTTGRGVLGVFRGPRDSAIEVTIAHYAYPQRRPRPIEMMGGQASIGGIRGGYSVVLHEPCGIALNGYGITQAQLERFARGLRRTNATGPTSDAGTIWPPDDFAPGADQACTVDMHERNDPVAVAKQFLAVELGWDDAIVIRPKRWWEPWYATRSAPDAYETPPGVELRMSEAIAPDCWSVESAGRYDGGVAPTGLGVSVRGDRIAVSYEPREGMLQGIADVRYGSRGPIRHSVGSDGEGLVELGFEPAEPGRLLLHYQDHDKGVFYFVGIALPPGDYEFE